MPLRPSIVATLCAALVLATVAGPATPAAAPEPPAVATVRVEAFSCVTKESEELAQPGGGPAGSHWNPDDARCDVTLAWGPAAEGARLDLHYGQGGRLPLVERRHVAPEDETAPFDTAPEGVRGASHALFVPRRLVEQGARRGTKDRDSGAVVYPVRFELVVTPLGPARPAPRPERRTLETSVSFGE